VQSYITQLELDPDAQRFRWRLKTGANHSQPPEHIIAVFGGNGESRTYLDGIDSCLDHAREVKEEIEAEYRSDMHSDGDACGAPLPFPFFNALAFFSPLSHPLLCYVPCLLAVLYGDGCFGVVHQSLPIPLLFVAAS
jgi:hypothetical protein